jgi:hypothetical protein
LSARVHEEKGEVNGTYGRNIGESSQTSSATHGSPLNLNAVEHKALRLVASNLVSRLRACMCRETALGERTEALRLVLQGQFGAERHSPNTRAKFNPLTLAIESITCAARQTSASSGHLPSRSRRPTPIS